RRRAGRGGQGRPPNQQSKQADGRSLGNREVGSLPRIGRFSVRRRGRLPDRRRGHGHFGRGRLTFVADRGEPRKRKKNARQQPNTRSCQRGQRENHNRSKKRKYQTKPNGKKAMSANSNKQPVAIVTGASSGVGLGITRSLLERRYRVVANSRTISKSKDLKPSADLVLVDGDIGKKETAIKVVEAATKHFGRVDLLVNNAGIYIPKPFTEYTPEDFETMLGTNVGGYFFVTQQVVAQMRKQ